MSDLAAARAEYKRVQNEAARQLAALQDGIEELVVAAYDEGAGWSISKICDEYGTKARVTVTDILTKHGVYQKGTFPGDQSLRWADK